MKPTRETYDVLVYACLRFGSTHWRGRKVVISFAGERILCFADDRTPVGVR